MNTRAGVHSVRQAGEPVSIISLSHDGRGIARVDGKIVFVEDALPGEQVTYKVRRRHKDFDEAQLEGVLTASPSRVVPRCAHFGTCGGCVLQQLAVEAQIEAKQQTLLDNLQRIGGVEPKELMAPLIGLSWGYRRRARLSVHRVEVMGRVLVGFTERHRPFVTDSRSCEILDPKIGGLIADLAALLSGLDIADRIPQVELAVADDATVLVLRVLAQPSAQDYERLKTFEELHDLRFYLQTDRPENAKPLQGEPLDLHYHLPDWEVDIGFRVTDFIQVNGAMNLQLVRSALFELEAQAGDQVLDLFCGLGNFTLPLARTAGAVTGVEGEVDMVIQARRNAERNRLHNVSFHAADLLADKPNGAWAAQRYQRILLDPPRAGAREVIAHFPRFKAERIVYVSCHPATLARDAHQLVQEQGYRFLRAGVLDMFPHTAHVEAIAVFERG